MVVNLSDNQQAGDVPQRTAYLGPEASFSHQAAVAALPQTEAVPLPSFRAILQALQESGADAGLAYDYAVLPIENSTNGSVVQALDLLAQCGLNPASSLYPEVEVIDEHYLEVHHCLFVARAWAEQRLNAEELLLLPGHQYGQTPESSRHHLSNGNSQDDGSIADVDSVISTSALKKMNIKTLYTHPQVWGQCNNILSTLLPPGHVERVDMSSTSAAAALVAGEEPQYDGAIAAISSSLAGAKHSKELVCIASNIEDEPGTNTTRFLILQNRNRRLDNGISANSTKKEHAQIKSLWTFTIAHHIPGSLAATLAVFAKHNFNLSAIQSRPRPKTKGAAQLSSTPSSKRRPDPNWQYVFFVECLHSSGVINLQDTKAGYSTLLEELKTVTEEVSLLGSWHLRYS